MHAWAILRDPELRTPTHITALDVLSVHAHNEAVRRDWGDDEEIEDDWVHQRRADWVHHRGESLGRDVVDRLQWDFAYKRNMKQALGWPDRVQRYIKRRNTQSRTAKYGNARAEIIRLALLATDEGRLVSRHGIAEAVGASDRYTGTVLAELRAEGKIP